MTNKQNAGLRQIRKSMKKSGLAFAACGVVTAALWLALWHDAEKSFEFALEQARRDSTNLAIAFREQISRTVVAIDDLLVALVEDHRRHPDEFVIPDWIFKSPALAGLAVQIGLIGPDGIVRASNLPMTGRVDLSDRPHFRHHFDAAAPQPHISVPVIGRVSKQWSVQFTRRLTRPDGAFDGMAVISVDPTSLWKFFDGISLGEHGAAILVGHDGIVRARNAKDHRDLGYDLSPTTLFRRLKTSDSGTFIATNPRDGIERVVSYSSLANYPLTVAIGLPTDEVLAGPRWQRTMVFVWGSIGTILILGLTWLLVQAARRRDQQELDRQAQGILAEEKRKLDIALSNMAHGLLMFDAQGRLVFANDRYIEMYGLSREVVKPGASLEEIINHRKAVGSFVGDPQAYCEGIRGAIKVGRTSAHTVKGTDGRTIRILNKPTEDGSWVVTLDDITEQLHAEQVLIEARTEAERAAQTAIRERAHLIAAFEVVPEGLALLDAEDRYVLWNRRYEELYAESNSSIAPGMRFEDVLQQGLATGQYPAAKGREEEWLAERLALHAQKQSCHEQCLPGDRWVRIEERRTADGGSIGIRIDITEIKRREESFRLLFDANPVPMWVIDVESQKFLAVNDAAVNHYGYSRDQFLAMTAFDVRPSEDQEEFARFVRTGMKSTVSGDRLWQHKKADGSVIYVSVYARPITYQSRSARINAIIDVTEQRRAEKLLEKQAIQTETAINNMSQGLLMFGADARLALCNRRYREMYGLSAEVVKPGCSLRELVEHRRECGTFAGDIETYCANISADVRTARRSSFDFTLADGRTIHSVNVTMADGGWVATHEDVTERLRTERLLREQKLQIDAALQNMSQGLAMFDADGRITLVNERYAAMMGFPSKTLIGGSLLDLLRYRKSIGEFSADPEQFLDHMKAEMRAGHGDVRVIEGSSGQVLRVVDQPMADGGWVSTFEDITEQVKAQQRIEYLAHHDTLTDLPNRVAFNQHMVGALRAAAQAGNQLALLCIDLDRFKEVNDVFGHSVGDALLKELGTRLKNAAGDAFVARLGGDEFCVVIDQDVKPAAIEELADRLHAVAAEETRIEGNALQISLSVGVAIYPADGSDLAALMANGEAALYRAKREGRGSVRFFEPEMDRQLRERRALQKELSEAIERHQLALHYQPQAQIDGKIVGFEALLRWHHPVRGFVSPAVFIPLAEDSGLIMQVGEWVLREACREAASWSRPLQLAVNLSPAQFQHGDLPALVHTILLESGLSPQRLELEITEGVLIGDHARALSILRRLKALGVRIAMDDFGTGYSSLSYLQSFPFDKIKIDRSFIARLDHPQSAAIIRSVIGLARGLSLPVTAEGVETKEQLTFLVQEGCDEMQGFLTGRPKPIEEYAAMVGRPQPPGASTGDVPRMKGT